MIEAGSTADGQYTRFADGTQICTQTLTASAAGATSWSYPVAFSAAPCVTGSVTASVLSALCLDAAPGTTSVSLSARDKADARRGDPVSVLAVGRWF